MLTPDHPPFTLTPDEREAVHALEFKAAELAQLARQIKRTGRVDNYAAIQRVLTDINTKNMIIAQRPLQFAHDLIYQRQLTERVIRRAGREDTDGGQLA